MEASFTRPTAEGLLQDRTHHRHPNLIDISETAPSSGSSRRTLRRRSAENVGLQAVFHSVFPIRDFNETASLEFVSYTLEKPKYDVQSVCSAA